MFYASFGKPSLEFICNHDAVIRLKLNEGHYNADFNRATAELAPAHVERNRTFKDVEAVFRVPFKIAGMRGEHSRIGNGQHVINMVILDYTKAQLLSVSSEVNNGRQALSVYLSEYLEFLQNAGNHVLFSLPDFDDDRLRVSIDFSTSGRPVLGIDSIFGISVEKINSYLQASWLKSAMLAGRGRGHSVDRTALSLAEYRSTWVASESLIHFHVTLGAPRIQALCGEEVVLFFTVDEVVFYESDDFEKAPKQQYSNWEIAVIVNVIHQKEDDGNVTRIVLDLSHCRFVHYLSDFPDYDDQDNDALECWQRLIDFFTVDYLDIIQSAQYHNIYHYDIRWPKPTTTSIEWTDYVEEESHEESVWIPEDGDIGPGPWTKPAAWQDITDKTDMQGFDQVIAISQGAINAHFQKIFSVAQVNRTDQTIARWSYEDYFRASFEPLTVRLLSNNKVLIWVRIKEGHVKTLRKWSPWAESEKHVFENWRLAFEVDIKMNGHEHLESMSSAWTTTFEDSFAFKHHGGKNDRALKHVYLDMQNTTFIHEFSSFDGLYSHDRRSIDKVQAIVTYLQSYYFTQFISSGYHVLYTIPVWKPTTNLPSYALTEAIFHVHSPKPVTRLTWHQVTKVNEPIIVILGMTGSRPLPALRLTWTTNWTLRATKAISYGTVSLSKRVFLEERLLTLLAEVNALTTVIVQPFRLHNNSWSPELTTLAQAERGAHTRWVLDTEKAGLLKYKWEHRDGWSYEHWGSNDTMNGNYSVHCTTKNYLEIPTIFKSGTLRIALRGEVTLQIGVNGATQKWKAESSAHWATTVDAYSEAGGLNVRIPKVAIPEFRKSQADGDVVSTLYTDPQLLLKKHLPGSIELSGVLSEFKAFEGTWQSVYPGTSAYTLAQPVFNKKGDILFELRPYSQLSASVSFVPPSYSRRASGAITSRSPSAVRRPSNFARGSIHQVLIKDAEQGGIVVGGSIGNGKIGNGNGNGLPRVPSTGFRRGDGRPTPRTMESEIDY
ncbi:hypothetical protein EW026_g5654 [Hermanssonia centrifuga]|uniref:Uncharacterized protein n=1 Tax=Hermanssonia centrifuga TaxID=98765 RepID=A0A4S4KDF0_9APHY|nr:hypothetical protein EW026_g5654 [Hermanssonia centrifuga]